MSARQSAKKTNNPIYKLDKVTAAVGIAVIGLIVLLIVLVVGPAKVKQVRVIYADSAAEMAKSEGLTDEDFIRNSQVIGKKMSEIGNWENEAKDNIAAMGGYRVGKIEKTSRTGLEMTVSGRQPIAVISTGGWYFAIDADKFITDKRSNYAKSNGIQINGITLRKPSVGQPASDTSTDDRLSNALDVVKEINDNGLSDCFTEIYMKENKSVWLSSVYNIPVNVSLWFKDSLGSDLNAAVYLLKEKAQSGAAGIITVVDGHAYWNEDMDEFYQIKGK